MKVLVRPCIVASVLFVVAVLSRVGTAQEITPAPPDIPAGLVQALEAVGQNLVGSANFFAYPSPGPPDYPNPGPPNLDVWLADVPNVPVHVNVFVNPGPPNTPRTWLRITLADGTATLQRDVAVTDRDASLASADLSAFYPPSPVTPTGITSSGSPELPAGLVRALEGLGQKLAGAANFFAVPNPGPPGYPNPGPPTLDVWLADVPNVAMHLNVFAPNPGPPDTPRTWLRLTVQDGQVTLQRETDTTVGDSTLRLEPADLSAFFPPSPIAPTR